MTLPTTFNVRDALMIKSDALPNAAETTKAGTPLDLGALTARGARLERCELLLTAPALATAILPDTKTMTYSIESAIDAAFTNPITLAGGCLVQTGAGGAGAASSTFRLKLPSNCAEFVRAKAVSGAATTDASALSMTLALVF